jgi:hypothetical protein
MDVLFRWIQNQHQPKFVKLSLWGWGDNIWVHSGKEPTWCTISSTICLFESSTCFEQLCAHHQEDNCMNTTSGIITLKMSEWSALQPQCIIVILVILDHSLIFRVIIPEVVFIQLSSWGWAHRCLKHVGDSNKRIIEGIVHQVGYLPELYEAAWSKTY